MAASVFELPQDKRDNQRQLLLLTASMTDSRGEHQVHLLNISHNGCKLDAAQPPLRDDRVTLRHDDLTVEGRVAWVEGNRFGIAFDKPIDERYLISRGQHRLSS